MPCGVVVYEVGCVVMVVCEVGKGTDGGSSERTEMEEARDSGRGEEEDDDIL